MFNNNCQVQHGPAHAPVGPEPFDREEVREMERSRDLQLVGGKPQRGRFARPARPLAAENVRRVRLFQRPLPGRARKEHDGRARADIVRDPFSTRDARRTVCSDDVAPPDAGGGRPRGRRLVGEEENAFGFLRQTAPRKLYRGALRS